MPRRDKKKKKARHRPTQEDVERQNAPKTMVINRTPLGVSGHHLMLDVRRIMEPNTASKLRAKRNTAPKEFIKAARSLDMNYAMFFSRTEAGLNLRMTRVPHGPTITFRVTKYSLIKDVISSQPKGKGAPVFFDKPPLLVLNNFNKPVKHVRLMAKMLQNMFPSIQVEKVALSALRRVALFYFNEETEEIELRHYEITVKPVGLSRGIKAVLRTKDIDLSEYDDISSFVFENADGYESDAETAMGTNKVVLPQTVAGAGNKASQQSAVKLVEIGPRLNLRLLKIEDGFCEGKVLHHGYLHKTPAEEKELERRHQHRLTEKARRRQEQERNIERKKKEREENRQRSIAGQRAKAIREGKIPADAEERDGAELWSDDDDNAYYREEVGEEVPHGMNLNRGGSGSSGAPHHPRWRQKRDKQSRGGGSDAGGRARDSARQGKRRTGESSERQDAGSSGALPKKKSKPTSAGGGKAKGNQARKRAALLKAREATARGGKQRGKR